MNDELIESQCIKSNGTKLRILYLYQHLVRHTDAEHTLSTAELMKVLREEYAVKVSRNTGYSGAAEPLFRKSGNRQSGIGNRHVA